MLYMPHSDTSLAIQQAIKRDHSPEYKDSVSGLFSRSKQYTELIYKLSFISYLMSQVNMN